MGLFSRGGRSEHNRPRGFGASDSNGSGRDAAPEPPEPVFDEPLGEEHAPPLSEELAAFTGAKEDPRPEVARADAAIESEATDPAPVSQPAASPPEGSQFGASPPEGLQPGASEAESAKTEPPQPRPAQAEQAAKPEREEPVGGQAPRTPTPPPVNPEPVLEEDEIRITAKEALAPVRNAMANERNAETTGDSGRHAQVISFANQKGGVAKTTTTLNLAVAFAESGHRVLCIDLDPQGNLTMSQGIDPDRLEKSMFDVLVHHMPLKEVIHHREIDVAVASIDLAGAEIAMSTQIGRERSLEKAIAGVADDYDFVCIDTPPSLGLLTVNALTASDKVIVPVQCEYLSMRGLLQLQNTLEMIRENLNPRVKIEGILPTMLDARTVHAKEAIEILEENFGDLVFETRIRKAIKFAEAPVRGASVLKYDPKGNAADYYRALAQEVLTNGAS